MRKDLIRIPAKLTPPGHIGPGAPRRERRKFSLFEDVSPGNVGNVFEIPPAETNDPPIRGYGNLVRVLDVKGDDDLGEMLCISVQQETVIERAISNTGSQWPEGPCTGVVEFGAGSGLSTLEFDIPGPTIAPGSLIFYSPVFPAIENTAELPITKLNNGALLTLPASSLRVFVRNDARSNFLWSLRTGVAVDLRPLNDFNLLPAIIRVHGTYGRRTTQARLTRSYPIAAASENYTDPINPGQGMRIGIPPYAKRVFFPRMSSPLTTMPPLQVSFQSLSIPGDPGGAGGAFPSRGTITIPAGDTGDIEIMPYDSDIDFVNPGPAVINDLIVVFELAI